MSIKEKSIPKQKFGDTEDVSDRKPFKMTIKEKSITKQKFGDTEDVSDRKPFSMSMLNSAKKVTKIPASALIEFK